MAGTLMPYFITDSNDACAGWAVEKEDGEVMGCHTTKQAAIDQMIAISLAEDIEPGGERYKKKKIKYKRDLPENYRPALAEDVPEGRACGNCLFFNEDRQNADGTKAWCERWKEFVDGGYYCNAWRADEEERQVNLTPPTYMRAAARRGLELNRQGFGGDGLTDKTKQEARDMAAGRVSADKWVRIAAWIARHMVDLDAPDANPNSDNYPSNGVVAHLLWGSGPSKAQARRAMAYAEGVVERIRAEEQRHGTHDQSSHGSWAAGGGKYSKGKDLLSDGTLSKGNSLDKELSAKTSKYNPNEFLEGKFSNDEALEQIAERQGFDGKPQRTATQSEYDAIQSPKIQGGNLDGQNAVKDQQLHRGFRNSADISSTQAKKEFEQGDYYAGKGIIGNGIYVTPNLDTAKKYSEQNTTENISNFKLSENAKIGSFSTLRNEMISQQSNLPDSVYNDVGRFAASKGFDGYVMDESPGGGIFVSNESVTQMVILNRTAVVLPPRST
jgi:hypothetical protein